MAANCYLKASPLLPPLITVVGGIPPWPPELQFGDLQTLYKDERSYDEANCATTPIAPRVNVRSQPVHSPLYDEASGQSSRMSCT